MTRLYGRVDQIVLCNGKIIAALLQCKVNRFRYCYNRCMKLFFGYSRYYSVTSMLLDLNLPSFDTIMYNSKLQFTDSLNRCNNNLVKLYRALS